MELKAEIRAYLKSVERAILPVGAFTDPQVARTHAAALRAGSAKSSESTPALASVDDFYLTDQVAVRVYEPSKNSKGSALVFFHGGGWVQGDLNSHDAVCRRLAVWGKTTVVSVDYRLAPENPFPAALEDGFMALDWVAETLIRGQDRRILLSGASSGANIAISLALLSTEVDGPRIAKLLLLYPALDASAGRLSHSTNGNGYGLTNEEMKWYWKQYARRPHHQCSSFVSPLLSTRLSCLPQTVVVTAERDVLRDEGRELVDRMNAAGGAAQLYEFEGQIHGFASLFSITDDAEGAIRILASEIND